MTLALPEPRELTTDDVTELYDMLTYGRPHKPAHEGRFIDRFLRPLEMKEDDFGNLYKRIGTAPILWSCHLDTVHRIGRMQHIVRDDKYIVRLAKGSDSNCLGADDTAGVWLMVQMIKANTPGLYIFHRGEEVGCQGSRWIATNLPDVLKGIKFAVALDRRDHDSVITFQAGQRCCSDDFAASMGKQLGVLGYKADPSGLYTDTASYVDIVGECTNLSVGYQGQHGHTERLDVKHLALLYENLIQVDVNSLVSKRKPGDKESRWGSTYYGNHHTSYCGNGGKWDEEGWRKEYYSKEYRGSLFEKGKLQTCTRQQWERWRTKTILAAAPKVAANDAGDPELAKVLALVKEFPDKAAALFFSWGMDADMLRESMLDAMFHKDDDKGDADAYGVH